MRSFCLVVLSIVIISFSRAQELELVCSPDYTQECVVSNIMNVFEPPWPEIVGGTGPFDWDVWNDHDGSDPCNRVNIRTWQVIDANQDTVSCSTTRYLVDNTPPSAQLLSGTGCNEYVYENGGYTMVNPDDLSFSVADCNELEQDPYSWDFEVEVLFYEGCGTSALIGYSFTDVCGNTGYYADWVVPGGTFCDDPTSCEYGTYGVDYWTGDGIGDGYGCENWPEGYCYDSESEMEGILSDNCECQILGCSDQLACNFSSEVILDDGTCCYDNCGCTDDGAANYKNDAECDDDSCLYSLFGVVFNDENANGYIDEGEFGLPFVTVTIEPGNYTLITNDQGEYQMNVPYDYYTITAINPQNFPFSTTQNPRYENVAQWNNVVEVSNIGLSAEEPLHAICIDLYPNGNGFLCNDWTNYNMCFRNMGNVPIDGFVQLEYDELFQDYQEITPIESVEGNTIQMNFTDLAPGEMYFYDVSLLTPTVDHIGEYITSTARVHGFYQGEEVAYGQQEHEMEITCAYDPNDKQAFPLGYTDDHWLLQETEQEFLIRFQNTGNAPAQNIRIQDTLDVNFDLSTFQLVANSHSVMTSLDPEKRLVDFYFEDIQLPDSVNNEPDSHGLVSYKIKPLPDLPIGTVLENTAYIYFDNNDPIITNTTWTTIHECGGEAEFDITLDQAYCNGEDYLIESNYEHLEEMTWVFSGESFSSEDLFLSFNESGIHEIGLMASNPLCSESNLQEFTIEEFSEDDPSRCTGDFNCDNVVSSSDLTDFLAEFSCTESCRTDLDEDGATTSSDLVIFLSVFALICE